MTQQRTASNTASKTANTSNTANPDRTRTGQGALAKTWILRLDISEEDEDVTAVRAVLDTGAGTLVSRTTAHRNPHDPPVPEIGDEYAAGRALLELGRQLLHEGTIDAAENAKGQDR